MRTTAPQRRRWALSLAAASLAWGVVATPRATAEEHRIRVCADPDNLPYSNRELEGFENKIAKVLADDLGLELTYYWWPHQRGLVRNTLKKDQCDVLIGTPKGYDLVLQTRPYYRTTHVLAYRSDRGLALRSLADEGLKNLKIGVHLNTPPVFVLAQRGLTENIRTYRQFFDARDVDRSGRPGQVLEDVVSGAIDVAVVWGPLAGSFVREHASVPLKIVPVEDETWLALGYEVAMGVKHGNRELKARLEQSLDRQRAAIDNILTEYGIPLLPLRPDDAAQSGADSVPSPR